MERTLAIIKDQPLPWFKDGLRFKCTGCGKCCTGSKGYVFLTEDEIKGMAGFLNISVELFKRKYTRLRNNRLALVEKKSVSIQGEYDCIFLNDKKCGVYGERPVQCRTYPWWPEILKSKESFDREALDCEGINNDAPIVPYEDILQHLQQS